jgi:hypothetical protein
MKVFKGARKIEREDVIKNKYLMNAYKKDLKNYRIMNLNHILKNGWQNDIPGYILKFINEHKEVLLIANIVLNQITQIQVRSIEEKNFTVMGKQTSVPYGLGMLSRDFKYGDWLVLVEGTSDRDALTEFYPNVVAVLSDGISMVQSKLIENLTNRVLILYDNDKEGKKGYYRDKRKLEYMGMEVERFELPEDVGDPGRLLELRFKGKFFEAENLENYFESWFESILS